MVFLESFSPVVFSCGDIFTPQGTFVNVWKCVVWLSQVGREACYWHLVRTGWDIANHPPMHRMASTTKNHLA